MPHLQPKQLERLFPRISVKSLKIAQKRLDLSSFFSKASGNSRTEALLRSLGVTVDKQKTLEALSLISFAWTRWDSSQTLSTF